MDGSFGARLRRHRTERGLTQEALAQRAKVSSQAVGALERGDRRHPRQDTVGRLADALELTEQERELLAQSAQRRGAPVTDGRVTPRQLPAPIAHFTGREAEIQAVITQLERTSTVITGMSGVGKTSLAVHVGHRVAGCFPDGQLYLDLRGWGPGAPMRAPEALGQLMVALGVPREEIPADTSQAAARYRSALAGQRVLLVLDNAADPEQVAPLVPGAPGCAAIITSRRALPALPQAHRIQLDVLSESEAVELLAATAGRTRVGAEPDAARRIVAHCGRLPLAVHLAGARLAARTRWPLTHMAERLTQEHRRLDELECDDIGVRAVFALSIDNTAADAGRDQLALLAVPDGPDIALPVAARLLDLPEDDAERVVERLVDLHLVQAAEPGRYRLHDLVRAYARERPGVNRIAALARVLDLYVAVAWRSLALLTPGSCRLWWADESWTDAVPEFADSNEALAWLDGQRAHLVAIATQPGVPGELVVRLAPGLFAFYQSRGHWLDWVEICRAALEKASDPVAAAIVRMDLGLAIAGTAQSTHGNYGAALEHLWRSLDEFEQAPARYSAMCLTNLSHVLELSQDFDAAIRCAERSLAINEAEGERRGQVVSHENIGSLHALKGDPQRALTHFKRALAISNEIGHRLGTASCLRLIAGVHRAAGRHAEALEALQHSVRLFRQLGDPVNETAALEELGLTHAALGDHDAAVAELTDGLNLACRYGDTRRVSSIRGHLDATAERVGEL